VRYQSKKDLLADIRTTHRVLCDRLGGIPVARWREAGVWGDGWTVADLVAHLAEWQDMFLRWHTEGLRGGKPELPAPGYKWSETPKLNRAIWKKHRSRRAAPVRADFDAGHRRIVALAEDLSPKQLLESGHFAWTGKHPLATYLGPNTASHYRFAVKVLGRWLKNTAQAGTPVWICPECGARLVTRNLWHSCGRYTLEGLFAKSPPGVLALARQYVRILKSLGDVQVIPQKTRLVCVARVRFAGLYPRRNGFRACFALRPWLRSPRIVKTEDYGPRWRMHYVEVRSSRDLDRELRHWLQESHDTVGMQSDLEG
jgi:hypothetical protein